MHPFRNVIARPFLAICLAATAFVTGSAVSARDVGTESWYNLCMSRCEQRYQACVANSSDHDGCYQRFLQCAAVCSI